MNHKSQAKYKERHESRIIDSKVLSKSSYSFSPVSTELKQGRFKYKDS